MENNKDNKASKKDAKPLNEGRIIPVPKPFKKEPSKKAAKNKR